MDIKIRPCRGDFFLKINKRACTSIRHSNWVNNALALKTILKFLFLPIPPSGRHEIHCQMFERLFVVEHYSRNILVKWASFYSIIIKIFRFIRNFVKVGRELLVQVNLFQKASFLHQVTHNMTRDCSLNSPKKFRTCCVQKLVFVLTFKTIFVHNLSELVFFREFNEQSLVLF